MCDQQAPLSWALGERPATSAIPGASPHGAQYQHSKAPRAGATARRQLFPHRHDRPAVLGNSQEGSEGDRPQAWHPRHRLVELATDGFADDFFRSLLGSESVQSIDYSDYERVDIVHDLNTPIPEALQGIFDALVDGGSLEHIFDAKQVLTNYMNMIKVGGCLFVVTTANNMCGHGFYQFSPEFFYRVFGHANGFIVNDTILIEYPLLSVETSRHQRCFRVVDPAKIGRRIELVTGKPVLIFLHATRISNQVPFRDIPLQSDYREQWQSSNVADEVEEIVKPFEYLTALEEFRGRLREARENSLANHRFFEPIKRVI